MGREPANAEARLGWALVGGLAVPAAARLLDARAWLWVLTNALTPLLYLPAHALAAAAAARGRPLLAASAGALGGAHLAWTLPEWRRAPPPPAWAASSPRLRLLTANLHWENAATEGLADRLAGSEADVFVLQEVRPEDLSALAGTSLDRSHPHRVLDPARGHGYGSAILSRLPLRDGRVWRLPAHSFTRATLDCAGTPVQIVNVHLRSPSKARNTAIWRAQAAALAALAVECDEPLVLAGDFNSTWHHDTLRALLAAGLRDAAVERGRGWVPTWPANGRLFPFLRLDHVLVSDPVAVLKVDELQNPFSDHRPLLVELGVRTVKRSEK